MLEVLPSENRVPSDTELIAYEGLREIRFRRDTALEVGLFIRDEDRATVVGFSSTNRIKPFTFEVSREDANAAFAEPWAYAPITGKLLLEEILEKSSSRAA